ncbi:hypothetical protein RJ641_024555 [Dillenia turbinata]|uniref:Uncharacterized protein n=1 Tax=Dillenia turbinata TaxID=194707 RepID=A0AAN8WBG3_9MAGN
MGEGCEETWEPWAGRMRWTWPRTGPEPVNEWVSASNCTDHRETSKSDMFSDPIIIICNFKIFLIPLSKANRIGRFDFGEWLLLALAGAGILWMGWTGFNGEDLFTANVDSSVAVLNTQICAAT